jgi:hypothetical protein
MLKRFLSLGLACGLSLVFAGYAMAKPATTRDLAGRTICYNTGEKATYLRGGKYENNMIGNGTWRVTSVGVQIDAERFKGIIDFEIQPDGTISIPAYHMTGKDCK